MFSMIFARPSIVVPATQAGGNELANSAARPPTARPRRSRMVFLMYAASRSPRFSSMSAVDGQCGQRRQRRHQQAPERRHR
jgi:hypothetical protein